MNSERLAEVFLMDTDDAIHIIIIIGAGSIIALDDYRKFIAESADLGSGRSHTNLVG
jgi:hypothetical protein